MQVLLLAIQDLVILTFTTSTNILALINLNFNIRVSQVSIAYYYAIV